MALFEEEYPSLESYWRAIILFGRNVASYKFAMGKSLLELAQHGKTFISLEELAIPFSSAVSEHLRKKDKQGTSETSRFLEACRRYNQGGIRKKELITSTVQLGFTNVIDAFHVVNSREIPVSFYSDERSGSTPGIRLTDELLRLSEGVQRLNLPHEIEARWRLVETAWSLNISRNLVTIEYSESNQSLNTFGREGLRRVPVTSCRPALSGYQKGVCFYCFDKIIIAMDSPNSTEVDHFFPHVLKEHKVVPAINGVWKLVLACRSCNRGIEGKAARIPGLRYLERLNKRNEFFISSHHPLRETIVSQTGISKEKRIAFLQRCYNESKIILAHNWNPAFEHPPAF